MAFPTNNYPQITTFYESGYPPACGMGCQKQKPSLQTLSDHFEEVDNLSDLMRAYEAVPTKNILMRNAPLDKEDVLKLASTLGEPFLHGAFPNVRDIRFDPNVGAASIALSSGAHPIHLDGTFAETPPKEFLLHFKISDPEGGGCSVFYSVQDIIAKCPWALVDAAMTAEVSYARKRHDGEATDDMIGHMIEKDGRGGVVLRWRYDDQVQPEVVASKGKPIEEFIDWVRAYFEETTPISYQAQSGDTIVIRQRYYLHGRTALSSVHSPRHAYRTWIY
ncbi:TauD/TfdA family dioxygenase [Tateyamaria sp.]|uniref:TauD/TfdA family dioxygenase n=1 Tax=Tateyamaria sp. TaxID=1929288 RepID=UPI00329AE0DF